MSAPQELDRPQPSPDPAHPEYGFWEVETPSLRDFPQQFRTFDIRRNRDNTISIVTTDIDPLVEEGTPEAKSRGYAIGAGRIFGTINIMMLRSAVTPQMAEEKLVGPLKETADELARALSAQTGRG